MKRLDVLKRVEKLRSVVKNIDLGGVIKSDYYTDASYDYELEIDTQGYVKLYGDIETKGSMLIKGDDIEIYSIDLLAKEENSVISIVADGNLTLGTAQAIAGVDQHRAVIIDATDEIEISVGEVLNIGYDTQIYTNNENSSIEITAGDIVDAGHIQAGATLVDNGEGELVAQVTGENSDLTVISDGIFVIGGQGLDANLELVARDANLLSTSDIYLGAGSNANGVGMIISRQSTVESTATDADITIDVDGSMQIDGLITARSVGSDVSITSGGMVYLDSLIYADDTLSVIGGTSEENIGLFVNGLSFDEEGNRLTGGVLDTATDGTITLGAIKDVYLHGVVGQLDSEAKAKTDTISVVSDSGIVNLHESLDAKSAITITTKDLNILQNTHLFTTDGTITIDADGEVYLQKSTK
jgi:hemin uptake protein HemP